MSTAINATISNSHIESLESTFAESTQPIKWLVITHDDAGVKRGVSRSLAGESAAVLEVAQEHWDLSGGQLAEAIDWALRQGAIENLVLVGHTPVDYSPSRTVLSDLAYSGSSHPDPPRGYQRLKSGAQQRNTHNRQAQEKFAAEVHKLTEIKAVQQLKASDDLAVLGLLYRAESGCFVAYDADERTFRALV